MAVAGTISTTGAPSSDPRTHRFGAVDDVGVYGGTPSRLTPRLTAGLPQQPC
jgi:hypothetical protein